MHWANYYFDRLTLAAATAYENRFTLARNDVIDFIHLQTKCNERKVSFIIWWNYTEWKPAVSLLVSRRKLFIHFDEEDDDDDSRQLLPNARVYFTLTATDCKIVCHSLQRAAVVVMCGPTDANDDAVSSCAWFLSFLIPLFISSWCHSIVIYGCVASSIRIHRVRSNKIPSSHRIGKHEAI